LHAARNKRVASFPGAQKYIPLASPRCPGTKASLRDYLFFNPVVGR
jgi:hypothetical protein